MIYLDCAATTFQKPPQVAAAMARAVETLSSPGRGGYPQAMAAAEALYQCRSLAGGLFGVSNPERVVLTSSATHGLNIAIKSLVRRGDRVLISGYEHNAVTRPLYALGADIQVAKAPLFQPERLLNAFSQGLSRKTACVVCTHVSNVFGYALPISAIAQLCRRRGVPLIVDASQSAGVLPVDLEGWGAAFVAMPGHKGLFGPQGTGLLLCNHAAVPLMEGGTGSYSASPAMPDFLPDRLEAGTHNVPGAAGLAEGLKFVTQQTPRQLLDHERGLTGLAAEGLSQLPGVRVFASRGLAHQTGVLSFLVEGRDCEAAAETLGEQGIALRAGLHCAPLAHTTAGTLETGTLRVSFSPFNREEEVEQLIQAVSKL